MVTKIGRGSISDAHTGWIPQGAVSLVLFGVAGSVLRLPAILCFLLRGCWFGSVGVSLGPLVLVVVGFFLVLVGDVCLSYVVSDSNEAKFEGDFLQRAQGEACEVVVTFDVFEECFYVG